jgi:Mg-chelatase subunit ChlD
MMRRLGFWLAVLVAAACGTKSPSSGAAGSGSAAGSATAATSADPGGAQGTSGGSGAGGAGSAGAVATAIDPEPVPSPDDATLGANIALAALGGRVIAPVEAPDRDHAWRQSNLLDGFPLVRGFGAIEVSHGWAPEAGELPAELVFAFRGDAVATIAAVVVDTSSNDNLGRPEAIPKSIDVQASTTSPTEGFTTLATLTPTEEAGEVVARFAPTAAKYVRLVVTATYGGGAPQLGEVQIYESAGAPSIVAAPANLLLPALGGSLVRFTSQDRDGLAAQLVDGIVDERSGWSSPAGDVGAPAALPQELTFAFRNHRAAYIDHLELEPTSGGPFYGGPLPNVSTWAKTIEIQTSDTSPWDGFTTRQVLAVPTDGKRIDVPIGASFRFLRLRVLENHGAATVTLGEVRAIEGAPPGGRSLLAGRDIAVERLASSALGAGQETAARREREPNNAQKEADPIDAPAPIGGAMTPASDRDVFRVTGAPGPGKQTLTVALEGRPAIRTRVTVIDTAGTTRFELDPARITGPTTRFSVVTDPGDLFVQVVQPTAAQVLVWDSSGSMERRVADLDAALHAYLDGIEPADRVQLVRFDDTIDVLMKDFSGDKAALTAALKDKVYADGGTSIYDAIGTALDVMNKAAGSRAIVMMTDGEDTTSQMDPSVFWRRLDAGRLRLYAIGLGNGLRNYVARAGATAERVLADAALSTGGRYLFVADSKKLGALYADIAAELRAPATYALAASVTSGNGTLRVTSTGDRLAVPMRVELVLDASGSMKRKVTGGTMMDAAKSVLTDVVARLPASATVALRVYGHRTPEKRAGACEDSELVVPFGPLDRKKLGATIKKVKALGTTPIAHSITAAGEDLKDAKGPAMLIVVTDGKEECGGDPAAAAAALRAQGLDVTVNVVGFSLTDPADREAMTKVAGAGGGRFFDAQGEAGLRAAIDEAMAVPYTVVDATGVVVARGIVGADPIAAPTGELTVRIDGAATPVVIDHVVVEAGKPTTVTLHRDGNEVGARISAPGGTL